MEKRKKTKIVVAGFSIVVLIFGGVYLYNQSKNNTVEIARKTLHVFSSVLKLLPAEADLKKEVEAADKIVQKLTAQDGQVRTYMILLQNNHELRPGGGFLGQYAIVKVKDAQVLELFVEDANIADQRITATVTPPAPLQKYLDIKKWKLRDSNFSPDFPTNVEKAKYFYRLSGRASSFDGVVAVNTDVFNHVLKLTGPITVPGYSRTFDSENGTLLLEELVEKNYLGEDVPAELKQNRKSIMKAMAPLIIEKLSGLNNIPRVSEMALEELRNKNIMLNFQDTELQAVAESVRWDGAVAQEWAGDYLMVVDANIGAFKSDYYVKRRIEYNVDFTGQETLVTLYVYYNHTATRGDWRTRDYRSYTRVYAPEGSIFRDRELITYPIAS
ncbi:MAG: DUF4012 domain-containing protein, partial [Candidatus Moranbacteria bacterium]|nr:DUF4012 domain-containing protein [Candidatus Moranbacteria bacterium]